uniref:CCHC-type domain-containing protein n=1 Tax=Oryza punctata TaxID=4537 RepID=A0A0E0JJN2_ORYPU
MDRSYAEVVRSHVVPITTVFQRLFQRLKQHLQKTNITGDVPVGPLEKSALTSLERVKRDPISTHVLNVQTLCGRCFGKGHSTLNCDGPFRCHLCLGVGHSARSCPTESKKAPSFGHPAPPGDANWDDLAQQ